ncbi:MAG: UDP-glucose 4-epimerase GalE [Desulfosarcinaceae bacterium]
MKNDAHVLITGGAGYIGSHINKLLNGLGCRTLIFDNLVNGHRDLVRWGEFIEGDLADPPALGRVFRDHRIDVVMHLAAFAYVGESMLHPRKYYTNNVGGTLNLLNAMADAGVPRLVFSSTCATYGVLTEVPVSEDHAQQPINPYGDSKLMVERIIREYCRVYGLKACVLRYFNAAGADPEAEVGERHIPETHLIPLVLDVACGKKPYLPVYGDDYPTPDGTCIRDFIHVQDIAQAHIQAMNYILADGDEFAFNLSNGNGYSIRQVIEAAHQVTGLSVRTKSLPRRPGDPPILVGRSGKARSVLDWRPRYEDLATIIETAWKWHRKEQDRDEAMKK